VLNGVGPRPDAVDWRSYRSWLTFRPSRKPVISAKDRLQVRRMRGCVPGGVAAAEAANPALGPRPSLPMVLVGLRRLLSPGDGGNWPLP
jgi:hypothetical protein